MRDWDATLHELGAVWHHDGNLDKPFVELTSGHISDTMVNLTPVVMRPWLLAEAARELAARISPGALPQPGIICGQAMGSLTFAHALAETCSALLIWTIKDAGLMRLDPRFIPFISEGSRILLAEDVYTSGSTSEKTARALEAHGHVTEPVIASLVNRSSLGHRARPVLSLVRVPCREWVLGQNPYTEDGQERVPPLQRPKLNWHRLTDG